MFAEHALQAFRGDGNEMAAGEFAQATEVEQLVLREQHQQDAAGVLQKTGLHAAREWQRDRFSDLAIGNAQPGEQLEYRGRGSCRV
ncbi:hypothetical protein D3C81_1450790 [compost metagenome]